MQSVKIGVLIQLDPAGNLLPPCRSSVEVSLSVLLYWPDVDLWLQQRSSSEISSHLILMNQTSCSIFSSRELGVLLKPSLFTLLPISLWAVGGGVWGVGGWRNPQPQIVCLHSLSICKINVQHAACSVRWSFLLVASRRWWTQRKGHRCPLVEFS